MNNFGICTETQFLKSLRTTMKQRRKADLTINATLGTIKTSDTS